jgi:hypothetical protein
MSTETCGCWHETDERAHKRGQPATTHWEHRTTNRHGRPVVGIVPLCAACNQDHTCERKDKR